MVGCEPPMELPTSSTPVVLPVRLTAPPRVSGAQVDPAPSRTGPVAAVTSTAPLMVVPHTTRVPAPLAHSGPCSCAPCINAATPTVTLTGPGITAPDCTPLRR